MKYMLTVIGCKGSLGVSASNLIVDGTFKFLDVDRDGDGFGSWYGYGVGRLFLGRMYFGGSDRVFGVAGRK